MSPGSGHEADWADDDQLLDDLGDAVRSAREVPDRFVETGKALFTWHGIDFELAALAFDSAESAEPVGVRAETAARLLTFVAGNQTIEVEVSSGAIAGQVIPAVEGTIDLRPASADAYADTETDTGDEDVADLPVATLDETGWFEFRRRPDPDEPFRLCLRIAGGEVVLTPVIVP